MSKQDKVLNVWNEIKLASNAQDKMGERYEQVLERLKMEEVAWKDITTHIISLRKNWPTWTTKGGKVKPINLKKALEEGIKEAVWLNRFNVYRNQYTDYGVVREKKNSKKKSGKGKGNKVVAVKKSDLKAHLEMILTMLTEEGNSVAADAVKTAIENI